MQYTIEFSRTLVTKICNLARKIKLQCLILEFIKATMRVFVCFEKFTNYLIKKGVLLNYQLNFSLLTFCNNNNFVN